MNKYRATSYGKGEAGGKVLATAHFEATHGREASRIAQRELPAGGVIGIKALRQRRD